MASNIAQEAMSVSLGHVFILRPFILWILQGRYVCCGLETIHTLLLQLVVLPILNIAVRSLRMTSFFVYAWAFSRAMRPQIAALLTLNLRSLLLKTLGNLG